MTLLSRVRTSDTTNLVEGWVDFKGTEKRQRKKTVAQSEDNSVIASGRFSQCRYCFEDLLS